MSMQNHRAEALRRLRANEFEITDNGSVLIAKMGLIFAGSWDVKAGDGPWEINPNLVVNEGILHLLDVGLDQGAANAAFYVAPFTGAITVAATLTAATFTATATEFTNYAEVTRVLWANNVASANAIGNTTTAALFTVSTGGGTIRGAGLVSTSTKSGTTGKLIAAARFATDKVMAAAEELRVKYTITGTSA